MRERPGRFPDRPGLVEQVAVRRFVAALGLCCLLALPAPALDIRSYYSPRNNERPRRRRTLFIVLHTTEGPAKGSLAKVHRYGEAHYFVEEGGRVYRVVHRSRVAYHAGRSMWNGLTNLDAVAIGI